MENKPRNEPRAATVRPGESETWTEAAELIDRPSNLPTAAGSRTPSGSMPPADDATLTGHVTGSHHEGSAGTLGSHVETRSPSGSDFSSSAAPAGLGSNTPIGDEPSGFQNWDARQAEPGTGTDSGSMMPSMPSLATIGSIATSATVGGLAYAFWRRRQAQQTRSARMRAALMGLGASAGGELPRLIGQAAAQSKSAWLPLAILPVALWLRERGKAGEEASAQLLQPLNLERRSEQLARQGTDLLDQYRKQLVRDIDPNKNTGFGWTPWILGGAVAAGAYAAYRQGWIGGAMSGASMPMSSSTARVRDVMTRGVETVMPDTTIADVARRMRDLDVGSLPVYDGSRLLGIVTDRDLSVRATAAGKDPNATHVREVMSPELAWVFEDDSADAAAKVMRERQIRRLPVLDRSDRLVGVVALADLATDLGNDKLKGATLEDISQPTGANFR
jgi:CBS domain-containing protein